MIGQGANDPRVKQAEADQIAFSMKEKGIPVEYVLNRDLGGGAKETSACRTWPIIALPMII